MAEGTWVHHVAHAVERLALLTKCFSTLGKSSSPVAERVGVDHVAHEVAHLVARLLAHELLEEAVPEAHALHNRI